MQGFRIVPIVGVVFGAIVSSVFGMGAFWAVLSGYSPWMVGLGFGVIGACGGGMQVIGAMPPRMKAVCLALGSVVGGVIGGVSGGTVDGPWATYFGVLVAGTVGSGAIGVVVSVSMPCFGFPWQGPSEQSMTAGPPRQMWPAMNVWGLERRRRVRRCAPSRQVDPAAGPAAPGLDTVDCTVFAPPAVKPGDTFFVQVFAHRAEQAQETIELAAEFDEETRRRGFTSLQTPIRRGTRLVLVLQIPGVKIDEAMQALTWHGTPQSAQFGVGIPRDCDRGTVIGTVTVSQESVPVGHVKFKLTIGERCGRIEPLGDDACRYRKAFVSYASKDRTKVLPRVQMLKLLGISCFQDLIDLDPGDRWERQLYRHIDDSDLFLLFWSSAARESCWVLKEVRYAINAKHGDELAPPEIRPVIIEGPPPVAPPPELAHLHFADPIVYFMLPADDSAPSA